MEASTYAVEATFLGHSTVLLGFGGGPRLLTDPMLRGRLGLLRRHGLPPDAGRALTEIDAVLISHAHHDHLDLPSLERLRDASGTDPFVVVPVGLGSMLKGRGFRRVVEVAPDDQLRIGEATILVTPADHDGFRAPFGPRSTAVGYIVRGGRSAGRPDTSVYFAGDTGLFPAMSELAGAVDLALLPVWGWGPVLGAGHLDPTTAVDALRLIRPRVAVPIHWGTLFPYGLERLWPSRLTEPGREFARRAAARSLPTDVRVLLPGESTGVGETPERDVAEAVASGAA